MMNDDLNGENNKEEGSKITLRIVGAMLMVAAVAIAALYGYREVLHRHAAIAHAPRAEVRHDVPAFDNASSSRANVPMTPVASDDASDAGDVLGAFARAADDDATSSDMAAAASSSGDGFCTE